MASLEFTRDHGHQRLSIQIGRAFGTVVVFVEGDVDEEGSRYLATILDDLGEGQGNLEIQVDLSRATNVSASAMTALARTRRWLHDHGGELSVAPPRTERAKPSLVAVPRWSNGNP